MTDKNRYSHCMVLSGGGFRFSYYMGAYAAAVETDNAPDLLLATCGGAIAAAVIQLLPDDESRKAWVSSPEMYEFFGNCRASGASRVRRVIGRAGQRWLQKEPSPRIPDLFRDYLFDFPRHIPLPPPCAHPTVSVAIIGGKLLYGPDEVNQPRSGRKLFIETVFGDQHTAALLQGASAPASSIDNAVSAKLCVESDVSLADAVRVSISDMFYLPCFKVGTEHFIGGVIDLVPMELAARLANRITAENKAPFNQLFAIPAIRAVLGVDGNSRMREVRGHHADTWFDTSDVSTALKRHGVKKALSWKAPHIRLSMPNTHQDYVKDVQAQWQYGYDRAIAAFSATKLQAGRNKSAGQQSVGVQ